MIELRNKEQKRREEERIELALKMPLRIFLQFPEDPGQRGHP